MTGVNDTVYITGPVQPPILLLVLSLVLTALLRCNLRSCSASGSNCGPLILKASLHHVCARPHALYTLPAALVLVPYIVPYIFDTNGLRRYPGLVLTTWMDDWLSWVMFQNASPTMSTDCTRHTILGHNDVSLICV